MRGTLHAAREARSLLPPFLPIPTPNLSRMKRSEKISEREALLRCTHLCAGSEQCEWNLREKMRKWDVASEAIERIINQLYDEKYLDEARFAKAYAHDKLHYSHWGRRKIAQQLYQLHVGRSVTEETLQALRDETYLHILRDLLERKAPSIKGSNGYERRQKLIRFALGRGFDMDDIRPCLPPMGEDAAEEMEDALYDEVEDGSFYED